MRLEDMPVEVLITRKCGCGNVSREFDQYAPCPGCGQKDRFRTFTSEPLIFSLDRARRRLALLHEEQR
jgi:hypothetical protein